MAKRTINDPQDTTQKAEDWATQTSPKIRGIPEEQSVSALLGTPV